MELMDGLVPLNCHRAQQAFLDGEGWAAYLASGGLRRRLRLLARWRGSPLGCTELGIAHGDLAQERVRLRVARARKVWLIDCDKPDLRHCRTVACSSTPRTTGAPELLLRQARHHVHRHLGFAVVAFQLLAVLHPFKSGDLVDPGQQEREEPALRGELPWVDHPEDRSNRASLRDTESWSAHPFCVICSTAVSGSVFSMRVTPGDGGWAEAFEAAVAVQVLCDTGRWLWRHVPVDWDLCCPFCDMAWPAGACCVWSIRSLPLAGRGSGRFENRLDRDRPFSDCGQWAGRIALRSSRHGLLRRWRACAVPADRGRRSGDSGRHGRQVSCRSPEHQLLLPLRGRVPLPRRDLGWCSISAQTIKPDVWRFKW